MIAIGLLFLRMLWDRFKSPQRLEAEIFVLRHQLNVLQQRIPRRQLCLRWVRRLMSSMEKPLHCRLVHLMKGRHNQSTASWSLSQAGC